MKTKQYIHLVVFTLFLAFSANIFAAKMPLEPQIYSYGGGPRAFNIGFSGVANVFDTSSLYINPAGLGQVEDFELSLQYSSFISGMYTNLFGAFAVELSKKSTLGFSLSKLSSDPKASYSQDRNLYMGDIFAYDERMDNSGVSDNQYVVHIGYGLAITRKLRFGFALKFFYQSLENGASAGPVIDGTTAGTYKRFEAGLDIGMQYDVLYFLSLGLQIRNLPSYALKNKPSTERNFPTIIRPGITFKALNDRLIFNLDLSIPTVGAPLQFNFGFSFGITKWFTLYGGASKDFFGGGFDFRPYEELIFYLGLAYHKTSSPNSITYTDGSDKKRGISINLGLTFIIRPPSKKINKQVRDYLSAQRELRQGNYGRATDILQDIARSDPDNRDLNELTREYLRIAQRKASRPDWHSARDRERIDRYFKQGKDNYEQGKYAASIRAFQKVLDIYPGHEGASQWLAKVRSKVNRDATRWYKIGEKYYINGKLTEAEKALRTCLSIDPEYEPARDLLSRIIGGDSVVAIREGINVPFGGLRSGRYPVAQGSQGAGIDTSATGAILLQARTEVERIYKEGESAYYRGRYLAAIVILKKFLKRSDNEELNLKAKELIAKARQKYKAQTTIAGRRIRSRQLFQLGLVAAREKRYRDAIDAFDRSYEADNTNYNARVKQREVYAQLTAVLSSILNEGNALRDQKDYDGAISKYNSVIQTDKEHELSIKARQLKAAVLNERKGAVGRHIAIARDALKNRQYQVALTNFNIVLRIEPSNREARRGREESLKLFQGRINNLLAKGRTELNRRNYPRAIVFFDRVLAIDRNNRAALEGKKQVEDLMTRASARRSVKENLEIARLRLGNRDYELAIDAANKVLLVQPRNIAAIEIKRKAEKEVKFEKERRRIMKLFSQGARSFRKRNYDDAINKWNKVLAIQTTSRDFDPNVIREYIARAKVLKRESGNIALREGDKWFRLKQYKKARESYKEALKVNPTSEAIRLKLTRTEQIISGIVRQSFRDGERLFARGQYEKSMAAFKKVLEYEEDNEVANSAKDELQRVADALKSRKQADDAMSNRKYADAITGYEYVLAINRSDNYAQDRRREAIVALSKQAARLKAEALTLINQKNYPKAIALLEIVVRFDRDDAEARSRLEYAKRQARILLVYNYGRGVRAYNARNWKAAIAAFNVVRSINPNYKETNKFFRRAVDNNNAISARASAAQQGRIQALFYQGVSLYRQNKLRAAIGVWSRILAIDPNNARARQYIQRARFRLGG